MTGWDGDWQGGLGEEKTGRRDDMKTENWEGIRRGKERTERAENWEG